MRLRGRRGGRRRAFSGLDQMKRDSCWRQWLQMGAAVLELCLQMPEGIELHCIANGGSGLGALPADA